MQPIQEIFSQIAGPKKKIVITMHQKPDADAMGSGLGLYHFLIQFGHEVQLISPTNWARWLNWMEGVNEVLDYELFKTKADEILDAADWLFCLDFNHFDRTTGGIKMSATVKMLTGKGIAVKRTFAAERPFAFFITINNKACQYNALYGKRIIYQTFGITCFNAIFKKVRLRYADECRIIFVKNLHPVA